MEDLHPEAETGIRTKVGTEHQETNILDDPVIMPVILTVIRPRYPVEQVSVVLLNFRKLKKAYFRNIFSVFLRVRLYSYLTHYTKVV